MARFVPLPVIVYNQKEFREGQREPDECSLIEVEKMIDINRIESYNEAIPASDFRDDNKIWTEVVTHSRDTFIVNMPFEKFQHLIDQYTPPSKL